MVGRRSFQCLALATALLIEIMLGNLMATIARPFSASHKTREAVRLVTSPVPKASTDVTFSPLEIDPLFVDAFDVDTPVRMTNSGLIELTIGPVTDGRWIAGTDRNLATVAAHFEVYRVAKLRLRRVAIVQPFGQGGNVLIFARVLAGTDGRAEKIRWPLGIGPELRQSIEGQALGRWRFSTMAGDRPRVRAWHAVKTQKSPQAFSCCLIRPL